MSNDTKKPPLTDAEKAANFSRIATKKPPLTDAEKAANFSRIATKRLARARKAIALLGNLSGSGYKSTTEQVEKIGAALQESVNTTMARLQPKPATDEDQIVI